MEERSNVAVGVTPGTRHYIAQFQPGLELALGPKAYMFVEGESFSEQQQTSNMPSYSINRSTLQFSLMAVLITGLFVVFLNGSSHPALDPQLDDHLTPTLISVDGTGDPSSPDASVSITSPLLFPGGDFRAAFSASLDFIQPPLRLLSYPLLPQGPPFSLV